MQETQNPESNSFGLHIYRLSEPSKLNAMVYDPIVCLIVQGAKQISIGEAPVTLSQGQYVVVGHDLPVLARITEASVQQPYLALILRSENGASPSQFSREYSRKFGAPPRIDLQSP